MSKDGTIAYSSVAWSVNPNSLDTDYLDQLNAAVAPATVAGLQVAYGGGAGQIGQVYHDLKSEVIGLVCALILLVFMFGSLIAAAIPLLSAIFSVGAGLSLLGLLASADDLPDHGSHHCHAARAGRGRGLRAVPDGPAPRADGHRDGLMDSARALEGTSGAAIVVAGGTVVISILGLYVSGVAFVGALGLAAAIVVAITMLAALTLVPAFMGVAGNNVRALSARLRARRARISAQEQARRNRRGYRTSSTSTAPSPAGAARSASGPGRGRWRASRCWSSCRSRCSRSRSGSPTTAPTPPPRAAARPTT